ncbi:aminodeoxychorismate lyase [Erysipelotrichaceae bacterium MTC7]|nr:aminodeoxychorismate lyase [Erysipelotrichaceae bacterium MTC7]
MSKKLKLIIISGVAIVLVVCISLFALYKINLEPVSSKSEEVRFQIVEGDNQSSIVSRLASEGIIKSETFAKVSAKLNGDDTFAVGLYMIDKSWSTPKILNYLTKAENIKNDEVLITFREGIWAKDIAAELEKQLGINAEALLALWNDETFLKEAMTHYEFLTDEIFNDQYKVKLEGYLFPETYYFNKEASLQDITYTFLNQFNVEYQKIKADVEASNMSIHEIVTLASVVQFESSTKDDMEKVAGVFYNRLNIGQKLESSVTVCYSLYEFDSWLDCEKQYTIDSPYNTYLYEGLPIGPILNPGKEALEATLHPAKHDYYYFIADVQGDGKVYYAKTYEEHLANVEKYLDY